MTISARLQPFVTAIAISDRFVPLCFLSFVLVRLLLILLVPVEPYSDGLWYYTRAIGIAEHWRYEENGIPTAYWPVGYPGFLGLLFAVTGPSILAAQLANLAFATLSCWLVYRISQQLFADELAARLAILILAIYPNHVAYTALIASEPLYTVLLLLFSYWLIRSRARSPVLGIGLAIGLGTLVKSQTALLAAVLVLLAIVLTPKWHERRQVLAKSVLMGLVALAVVLPWTVRNYMVLGAPVFVSTNGGMSLLAGNNPSMVGLWHRDYAMDAPLLAEAEFSVVNQVAADRRARALALQWIRDNPRDFISIMPQKLWRLWAPDGEAEWSYDETTPWYDEYRHYFRTVRYANQALYVAVLALAGLALIRLIRRRANGWSFYGYVVAAFFTALSLVFSGQSRYHYPVMPFMIMYAGWYLASSLTVGPNPQQQRMTSEPTRSQVRAPGP